MAKELVQFYETYVDSGTVKVSNVNGPATLRWIDLRGVIEIKEDEPHFDPVTDPALDHLSADERFNARVNQLMVGVTFDPPCDVVLTLYKEGEERTRLPVLREVADAIIKTWLEFRGGYYDAGFRKATSTVKASTIKEIGE